MPHFPKPFFRKNRGLWYVQINGKQISLGAEKAAAFEEYHRLMAIRSKPGESLSSDPLVSVLSARMLHEYERTRPKSVEWYRTHLAILVKEIPDLPVSKLKPHHVLGAVRELAGGTTRGVIVSIRRVMLWSIEQGFIEKDPLKTLKRPKARRRETLLTQGQISLVLKAATDDAFRVLLIAMIELGCRPDEVCRVEARHIAPGRWVFPADEHKTGEKTQRPRVIYLTTMMEQITSDLVARFPSGPLFRNSKGKPWNKDSIRNRLRRMRSNRHLKGKLPSDLCAYLFRHAYATESVAEKGMDVHQVAQLMGHTDARMFERHYGHLSEKSEYMKSMADRASSGLPFKEILGHQGPIVRRYSGPSKGNRRGETA